MFIDQQHFTQDEIAELTRQGMEYSLDPQGRIRIEYPGAEPEYFVNERIAGVDFLTPVPADG